jgi:hypothetical protein
MKLTTKILRNLIEEQMNILATEHENYKTLFEQEVKTGSGEFTETAFNSMMAASVFDGEEMLQEQEFNFQFEFSLPNNPNQEVIKRFYESLYSGQRAGFLSYYSEEELAKMHLYIIEGINAGFALKGGNDIVSVHNNSNTRGLGKYLINVAKEKGGTMLDHFDGYLSGLYRGLGFTDVYEVYQWDEQYKPKQWTYDAVDIFNPKTSIYSDAMVDFMSEQGPEVDTSSAPTQQKSLPNEDIEVSAESGFKITINPNLKYNQYLYGRPDVIMRRL